MSTFRHSVFIALSLALLGLAVIAMVAVGSESLHRTLVGAAQTTEEARNLVRDLRKLTSQVDRQVEGVSGNLVATMADLQGAATSLSGAAGQLEQVLGRLEQPVDDFADTGLYESTQLIGETRLLVAALSRITKDFERDPTGSLLGRSVSGYRPE